MTIRAARSILVSFVAVAPSWAAHGDVSLNASAALNDRFVFARAVADGMEDIENENAPTPFGGWADSADAVVDGILGDAEATATQQSSATTNGMGGSGSVSAFINNIGTAQASVGTKFAFDITGCQGFGYFSQLGSSSHNRGSASFSFFAYDPVSRDIEDIGVHHVSGGAPASILFDNGILSEGTYLVDGFSEVSTGAQDLSTAPDYSFVFNFQPCLVALIDEQPVGSTVAEGGTAVLSVGASAAALAASAGATPDGVGTLAYQWRHGGVDLVDDGRISGATSATLTIANFGAADAGGYHVWVSDGGTRQLSSLAVLQLPAQVPALSAAQIAITAGAVLLAARRARRARR